MSEEEKRLRQEYRYTRKKWILYQLIAIAVVLCIVVGMAVFAVALNKTYYVDYEEKSQVDYGVKLKDNDFFDEDFLGKDYSYVASLIDKINAQFKYQIKADTVAPADFEYTYRVDALVQIREPQSGKVIYTPVYNLTEPKSDTKSGTFITLIDNVSIDYAHYNNIAESFVTKYQLEGAQSTLVLKMTVDMKCISDEFENGSFTSSYFTSVDIPLAKRTVEVKLVASEREDVQSIVSYSTKGTAFVLMIIAIVFAVIDIALAVLLICFVELSKNYDTTYEARLGRLLRNYKSYIQKINNAFDTSEYKLLWVDTFEEMLEIRDTILSPILMNENEDKTCATFVIPKEREVYIYELKVGDYDEIYGKHNKGDHDVYPEYETYPDLEDDHGYDIEAETDDLPRIELKHDASVITDDVTGSDDGHDHGYDIEDGDKSDTSDADAKADDNYGGKISESSDESSVTEIIHDSLDDCVEVVGVVLTDSDDDTVYDYDPDGEWLEKKDVVLVSTYDGDEKEVEAEVAVPNQKISPDMLKYPLKKIISVLRRNVQKTIEGASKNDSEE